MYIVSLRNRSKKFVFNGTQYNNKENYYNWCLDFDLDTLRGSKRKNEKRFLNEGDKKENK